MPCPDHSAKAHVEARKRRRGKIGNGSTCWEEASRGGKTL